MISIQLKKTTKGVAQRHCTERKKIKKKKSKQDRNQKNKDITTVLDVKSF